VVDAVRCAVETQRGMLDREPEVPEERRIRFRIGINLGDVIVDEHDIFGDGVNVAARLEALAGLCSCISSRAQPSVLPKKPANAPRRQSPPPVAMSTIADAGASAT
jgi:adenylate cyclase